MRTRHEHCLIRPSDELEVWLPAGLEIGGGGPNGSKKLTDAFLLSGIASVAEVVSDNGKQYIEANVMTRHPYKIGSTVATCSVPVGAADAVMQLFSKVIIQVKANDDWADDDGQQ